MIKKVKDLKRGDVIKVIYGDFDNWVTVKLIEDIKRLDEGSWEYTVVYVNRSESKPFKMYSLYGEEEVKVIENE